MKLYYTNFELPTGLAYAAATEKGIARIELSVKSESGFLRELEAEFGVAPVKDERPFKALVKELRLYFAGKLTKFTVPLDMRGTEFQMKVWKALSKIPSGQVRSYKQLAVMVGNPDGARAIGGAMNRNPVPIIVPCHRVIESSGGLGGYGGGLDKKRMLLKLEGALPEKLSSRAPAAAPRKAPRRQRSRG